MKDALITTATEQDITSLNTLVNSAYRGENSRKGWTTEADLLDGIRVDENALRVMLRDPAVTILKYEQEGHLLGCVYLEKKDIEAEPTIARQKSLYLGMLTVAPESQANGIGRTLLEAAEQRAVAWQCRAIVMTVITARHELIAWYQRRGYEPTGETKPFPNDPRFGIPKQPLSFIVLKKEVSLLTSAAVN